MPAILAMAATHKSGAAASSSWIGAVGSNGNGANVTIPYPTGTQSGDLVVYIHAGGPDATPSGFTSVFNTAADGYGYVRYIKTKIAGAETSLNVATQTGFDVYVITLRGYTTVSTTHQFSTAASGGTTTYTVASTPKNVLLLASDRGASSLPTTSTTGRTGTYSYSGATYFRGVVSFYPNMGVGTTVSATDFNDTYSTTGLFLTVS